MTPKEYQQLAKRTQCPQPDITRDGEKEVVAFNAGEILHACVGISGEAGELAAAVERWIWYRKDLDKPNIKEELGDLLWYIAEMCNALGLDLDEIMEANIRKLRVRYPDKYTDVHAEETNRDRSKERNAIQG